MYVASRELLDVLRSYLAASSSPGLPGSIMHVAGQALQRMEHLVRAAAAPTPQQGARPLHAIHVSACAVGCRGGFVAEDDQWGAG